MRLPPLQWCDQGDSCALAWRRGDAQFATDQLGALVHVDHTQTAAFCVVRLYGVYVKSTPIVLYLGDEHVLLAVQAHPDVFRLCVFAGVAYGFLDDVENHPLSILIYCFLYLWVCFQVNAQWVRFG
jgi:hypothetical protein